MKISKIFKGLAISTIAAVSLSAASISEPKVEFTGYKTPTKAATSGSFTQVKFTFGTGNDIAGILKGASAVLNPANLDMGEGNDAIKENIVNAFFKTINGGKNFKVLIQDVVVGENQGVLSARVTIGKGVDIVPLVYKIENGMIVAKGQLNLHAFAKGAQALKALSDVAAGHQGISWPVVDLVFKAKITQ